ncbi:hypothetical protein LTR85_008276 [Meristemomyces frigidus]|nr:hypothetical protein LTR85_008276 [Meristemomyces frigidus]
MAPRKKYFSSVERLRIAQQSAAEKRKKQRRKQTWLSSTSSTDIISDSTAGLEPRPSTSESAKQRQTKLQADQGFISREQAQWFVALPEKARRQHFCVEEQLRLSERCEEALSTPEPASTGEPGQSQRRSSNDEHAGYGLSQPAVDTSSHQRQSSGSDASSLRTVEVANGEMPMFKLYSRRRASVGATATSLPPPAQPAQIPPPPPSRPHEKPKRKSFHRALTLTPLALPAPTLTPIPPVPSPSTIKQLAVSARLSRPYLDAAPLAPEELSEAKYYQDPDARRQLRQYLASPQKFDEAIEFGFPSPDQIAPSSSGTDRSFPIQHTPSPSGDDRDDTSFDSSGPPTPTEHADDRRRTIIQSASLDSGIGLPLQTNMTDKAEDYDTPRLGVGREMTLRMTLTRPELRLSEEKLRGHRRTETTAVAIVADLDPLALGSLPVCDDHTGAHGAFAIQGVDQKKGLKRVWKSIRRR